MRSLAQPEVLKAATAAALLSALSAKFAAGDLIVVDELDFEAPKTQEMARILANLGVANALVVLGDEALNTALSLRNIQGVQAVPIDGLNTYNVLYHNKLIITKEALALIEEVYG